jgi:anti-anti-sigma regulatory factor
MATTAGMLTVGMAEGIGLGCVTAGAMAMLPLDAAKRLSYSLASFDLGPKASLQLMDETGRRVEIDGRTRAWQLSGKVNFLSMGTIDRLAQQVSPRGRSSRPPHLHFPGSCSTLGIIFARSCSTPRPTPQLPSSPQSWSSLNHPVSCPSPPPQVSHRAQEVLTPIFLPRQVSHSSQDTVLVDLQGVASCEYTGGEELINRLSSAAAGRELHLINCTPEVAAALRECDAKRKAIIHSQPRA